MAQVLYVLPRNDRDECIHFQANLANIGVKRVTYAAPISKTKKRYRLYYHRLIKCVFKSSVVHIRGQKEMKKGKAKYMYISRYTKFWQLRFRDKGETIYRESFSDKRYGSKALSLIFALKKRDSIGLSLGINFDTHWNKCKIKKYRYRHTKITSRNKTGIVGVSHSTIGKYHYYRASICLEKYKETVKCFNCNTLGDLEALKQAIAQRKEWEEQLLNIERT